NTHQQSTYWTQSQGRVSKALERIRRLVPLPTRGRSRMRESRTYGSGRGACDETHVPTATKARVYHTSRRRGGVAARGRRAAGRKAADHRLPPWRLLRVERTSNSGISQRIKRNRLHRRRERRD